MLYALVNKKTKKLDLVLGYYPDPKVYRLEAVDVVEIPDQSIQHLYRGDPPVMSGTLSDLRQYTKEEKAAIERPKKAKDELLALGSAKGAKSVKEVADRVALIEEILGV